MMFRLFLVLLCGVMWIGAFGFADLILEIKDTHYAMMYGAAIFALISLCLPDLSPKSKVAEDSPEPPSEVTLSDVRD